MRISKRIAARYLTTSCLLLTASHARAGVPFVTDDPGTPAANHYEIVLGTAYTYQRADGAGAVPGLEVNYGLTDNFQAHLYVPVPFDHVGGAGTGFGLGDIDLGFKYRIADAGDGAAWVPSIALAPTTSLPTGATRHEYGTGSTHLFLPLWFEQSWGKWTGFGGGGYSINPGAGNRNWSFSGGALTYDISPTWTVGGEVFFTTAAEKGDRSSLGLNLGANYSVSATCNLLLSMGPNLGGARDLDSVSGFAGVQLRF